MKARLQIILLVVASFVTNVLTQEVSIPDPGLNAAIRETLAKPAGPLTVQDLLSLTNLNAMQRGVSSLEGLGAAHNLTRLDLGGNQLRGDLTFPPGLINLTDLGLYFTHLSNLALPADLSSLTTLALDDNELTNLTLPAGLTNLTSLGLGENRLTNLILPANLTSLTYLDLGEGLNTGIGPFNRLTDFSFLSRLPSLTILDLSDNGLTNLTLPVDLTNLTQLRFAGNRLTDFFFLSRLPSLSELLLLDNGLTNLTLPSDLKNLTQLWIEGNPLTDFSFLSRLPSLTAITLGDNQLTSLTLPAGRKNLAAINAQENPLTSLTLPADLTSLTWLNLIGDPLKTLVLSEQLAATGLAGTVTSLRGQGVSIYTYPLTVILGAGHETTDGAFEFTLTGPPGTYTILGSADLAAWSELTTLTNELGTALFSDLVVKNSLQKFYRARRP
jgi:internalin A